MVDERAVESHQPVERGVEDASGVLGHVLPEVAEPGARQSVEGEAPGDARERVHRDSDALRTAVTELRAQVQRLQSELADAGRAARSLEGRIEQVGGRRGILVVGAAGIASVIVGTLLLVTGLATYLGPSRSTAPAESPPPPSAASNPVGPERAPGLPAPAADEAEGIPATVTALTAETVPEPPAPVPPLAPSEPAPTAPAPRNVIGNFRAISVSGSEMRVTVDYRYVGTHGATDIFLHAAALQDNSWTSRVPGTSFPEARIAVGAGTVTISITKVPDTGNATSTRVRTCMVSIPNRQAFACRTFAFAKDWSGGAAAVSPAATAAPGAL